MFASFLLLLSTTVASSQSVKVVGYLPTYRFSWLADIEFERVTHVNISFANPDSSGQISFGTTNVWPAVDMAHQHGCKVFVSLAGGYLTPAQDETWNYLTLPANRPAFIQKIVQYVQANDFDGVDIDLEWQYVKPWYSPFILELKAALQPLGIQLTAALPGEYRYPAITNAALAAFDWINMMIYDLTGPWAPDQPGPHSPYSWTVECVQYWKSQGVPGSKLTLGVPFYGYNFGVSPVGSFTFRGIVNQDPANAYLDQSGMKYWNGIPTIQDKTLLALQEVSGVMIWELGQDAFGSISNLSLLTAIDQVIDENTSSVAATANPGIRLVPVPATDFIHVNTDGLPELVSVYDLNGRLMISEKPGTESFRLDISGLPAGLYWLHIIEKSGQRITRFQVAGG
ncbi:MAG: Chitinase precursor [Bacteroidota bacterium]